MTSIDPRELTAPGLAFLRERHLGTLGTLRADGSPHLVPVGFSYDPDDATVRIITQIHSQKAANARRRSAASISQTDGGRWITLEGISELTDDPERVERAVGAYAERYQEPRSARAATRVAIEIRVERIMGRW
jgi:PPOX class probable F420-dependent enzyme